MRFFGYDFKNEALLEQALTTPSYRMDHPAARDNQRLEFLGDAVLGILAAERLFDACPNEQEGPLTIRRTRMVSAVALCQAAARLGLADHLRRNRAATPLPPNSKILADAVEAIIGAAYREGGFAAARQVFQTLDLDGHATLGDWNGNPKGELQMRAQAMKPPRHPAYELLKIQGRAHEPVFTVRVTVDDVGSAEASARSRKEAESQAAANLLTAVEDLSGTDHSIENSLRKFSPGVSTPDH